VVDGMLSIDSLLFGFSVASLWVTEDGQPPELYPVFRSEQCVVCVNL
jgi:hypothetical protein